VDNAHTLANPSPIDISSLSRDAEAAELVPDKIKLAGRLRIGIEPTYAPDEFKDASGKPIGWSVELMDAVATKLGLKTEYHVALFDNIIPGVMGAKFDLGLSSVTDSKKREQSVDFVNYFSAGILWASSSGRSVDPNDACGLKVAVQATTFGDIVDLPAKSKACLDAGKKPITKLKYLSQDDAINAVVLGRADAFDADASVTRYSINRTRGKLQIAGEEYGSEPYGMPVAKNSGTLKEALMRAIQSLIDDKTYGRILENWGVSSGGVEQATINGAKS
jgi:polar amino acid transport system substrate-binding protein